MKFNFISHYNSTEFNYPFEELRKILNQFAFESMTTTTFNWFQNAIELFKYNICTNFRLSESEIGEFELNYNLNEVATVRCKNMFTACILYDHYLTSLYFKWNENKNEVVFTNGDRIYYDNNVNEFIMELGNVNDNIDFSNNFIIKPEIELIENVPTNAIEIIKNKEYQGNADGNFEIRTINDKIWLIPLSTSVELDEIIK